MNRHATFLPLLVAVLVIISALLVVQIKHHSRELSIEIASQRQDREQLNLESAQLQLEEATLAQHSRVEDLARSQLQMLDPTDAAVVSASR